MRKWQFAIVLLCPLALLPLAASARPRDDAMIGAYRCAVIGDSRQWLDCYYGAAQPVRAALGLKPASAGQIGLVSSPPAGAINDIAVRDAVMAGAGACAAQPGERQWLDCYYAAAQPMRVTLKLAPQAGALPAPQPAPPRRSGGDDIGGDHLESRMASYRFSPAGVFTVTLENGQVWRQVDGDTDHAHWNKPPARYVARLSHGFLGSYNLQVKGLPGKYKVIRES